MYAEDACEWVRWVGWKETEAEESDEVEAEESDEPPVLGKRERKKSIYA